MCSKGLQPMEGNHARAVPEELQLMARTQVGEVCQGLILVGTGEKCELSSLCGGRRGRARM